MIEGFESGTSRMSVCNSVKARLRSGVEQGDQIVFAFFGREDEYFRRRKR
jgi:hypothetical protein